MMVSEYKSIFMKDTLPGDLMVNKENYDYMCPICLLIPNPNTAMEHKTCKKIYCRICITSWFNKNNSCPNCMKEIVNPREEFPPVSASNIDKYVLMKSLFCRCPSTLSISGMAGSSCPWKGSLEQVIDHLSDCSFIYYPCKWGCGKQFNNVALNKHETEECARRIVKCKYCQLAIKFASMENHFSEECQNNPDTIVNCEFKEMGCPYTGKRSSLEKHNAENMKKHLECIVCKIEMQKVLLQDKDITIQKMNERAPKKLSTVKSAKFSPSYSSDYIEEALLLFKTKNKHFLKCKKGHNMEASAAVSTFVCNGCGQTCDRGVYHWSCVCCSFFICADCSVLAYPKDTMPYLFSYCPYCPPEQSILIKRPADSCRFLPLCQECKRISRHSKLRYYCAYCDFSVCDDCQVLLS